MQHEVLSTQPAGVCGVPWDINLHFSLRQSKSTDGPELWPAPAAHLL